MSQTAAGDPSAGDTDIEATEATEATGGAGDAGESASASASASVSATGRLAYQPALDGLRGLALLAIIVYHAEVGGTPGAFLSVSTFFTLSGFLITSLLLTEAARDGGIALSRFWARRFRRLLPAGLATIALIVVAAAFLADSTQLSRLRGDALASLLYVANWRFILAGDSYGAIFESPSPFTHFWTLAIEEQFYVVFPLLMVALLRATRGSRRAVGIVLALVAVYSTAWSAVLLSRGASIDRLYFGTDTRLAELVAGGVLAAWWVGRDELSDAASRWARWAGVVALVAVLGLWATAEPTEEIFYQGGFLAYSLLTLTVILAAVQPAGPVRWVLSLPPLVWVGLVSYAAYLLHWPILIWLEQHTAFEAPVRLVVGLALTLAVAAASLRFYERPVRFGRWPRGRLSWVAVPAGFVLVAQVVVITTVLREPDQAPIDFEAAAERVGELGAGGQDGELTEEQWAALDALAIREQQLATSTAPRFSVYGDSAALMTALGMGEWAWDHLDQLAPIEGWAQLGCGLLPEAERRHHGGVGPVPTECQNWPDEWRRTASANPPDIAVIQLGPWDVVDVRLDGGDDWLVIGEDPALDDELRRRLEEGIEILAEHSQLVVLFTSPTIEPGRVDGRSPREQASEADPERMARFNEIVAEVAAGDPRVRVIDLGAWVAARPDDDRLRPDGIHFTEQTTEEVAAWLAPELVAVWASTGLATRASGS